MTKFFGKHRSRNHSVKNGLSDATNFPLLSTRWLKGKQPSSTAHFSARRLLCFVGDRHSGSLSPSYAFPDPKTISPTQAVATAWMEMATSDESSSSSKSKPPTRSTENSVIGRSRDRSITTHRPSSRQRPVFCGSRRMPDPRPHNISKSTRSNPKPTERSSKRSAMEAREWKSAVDPKSGRTYYYNVRTRETQWRKPMELASPAEQKEMAAKERKQKDFFAAMEANILKSMAQGIVPGTPMMTENEKKMPSRPHTATDLPKPRNVRTISGMDDTLLRDLVKRVPSLRTTKMSREGLSRDGSLTIDDLINSTRDLSGMNEDSASHAMSLSRTMNMSAMEVSLADLNFNMDEDSPSAQEENRVLQQLAKTAEQMTMVSGSKTVSPEDSRPAMRKSLALGRPSLEKPCLGGRRNTCGTLYVGSTMSAPDKDATIKCVCGVYRAHILSAAKESFSMGRSNAKYRIFNDRETDRIDSIREDDVMESHPSRVPTLDEITNFYRDVFRRAQMESDCIIMSLIYVERLIKDTDGGLRPRPCNWRSLLFSCMILSSKVWDDLSMWNADFSQTCPSRVHFSLQRINELEVAVLNALGYKVKVPASEYAKYYFLLRSMLIKSGLGGDDMKTMTPLDVEGAKKLEQVSSSFEVTAETKRRVAQEDRLRSKSMGHVDTTDTQGSRQDTKASLEYMVEM